MPHTYLILLACWWDCPPQASDTPPSSGSQWERSALAQQNGSRQDGGKLPGVRVVGAADAPGRLPIKFHYSGFWDFLQSCFGGMGPLSACQQRKRAANFSAALVDGYLLFVVCFNGKRLIHLLCCMLILLLIQPKSRL